MTAEVIQILSATIPQDLFGNFHTGGRSASNPEWGEHEDVLRFIALYRDMEFGWHYARTAAAHNLPVAGAALHGDDEILYRAYLFCRDPRRFRSPDIAAALALATGAMQTTRLTLDGMLLAADATAASVAAKMGLPVEGVAAYERLFFNVIDRKRDLAYLQHIVYPHGRMVEMVAGYFENAATHDIIKRAGFNNGPDQVMYLMGASNSAVDALSKAAPKQLEELMMSYALLLAQNGALNHAHLGGMSSARQLLTAGKLGGEQLDDRPLDEDFSAVLRREVMLHAGPVRPSQRQPAAQ